VVESAANFLPARDHPDPNPFLILDRSFRVIDHQYID
jgi:hypothetical protein